MSLVAGRCLSLVFFFTKPSSCASQYGMPGVVGDRGGLGVFACISKARKKKQER
jgi:hypothetical protein